jgi:hypothetical protein
VQGRSKNIFCIPLLHNSAGVHDGYPICKASENGRIVTDYEQCSTVPAPDFRQQSDDLCLQGRVQLARGLVGNQQRGAARNRLGNRDPLALAPAELVWVRHINLRRLIKAQFLKQLVDSLPALPGTPILVRANHLCDLVAHSYHWIECERWILRDQRDLFSANRAKFVL